MEVGGGREGLFSTTEVVSVMLICCGGESVGVSGSSCVSVVVGDGVGGVGGKFSVTVVVVGVSCNVSPFPLGISV